jgi:Homeodomain-like domain
MVPLKYLLLLLTLSTVLAAPLIPTPSPHDHRIIDTDDDSVLMPTREQLLATLGAPAPELISQPSEPLPSVQPSKPIPNRSAGQISSKNGSLRRRGGYSQCTRDRVIAMAESGKLSMSEVARVLGISRSTLAKWKARLNNPKDLAAVCKITPK